MLRYICLLNSTVHDFDRFRLLILGRRLCFLWISLTPIVLHRVEIPRKAPPSIEPVVLVVELWCSNSRLRLVSPFILDEIEILGAAFEIRQVKHWVLTV